MRPLQWSPARAKVVLLLCTMAQAALWAGASAGHATGARPQILTTEPTQAPTTAEATTPPTVAPATTRPTAPRTTLRRVSTTRGPSTTPPSTSPTTVAGTLPPTTAGAAPPPSTTPTDGSRPGEGKMPAWPMVLSGAGIAGAAGILGGQWMRTRMR